MPWQHRLDKLHSKTKTPKLSRNHQWFRAYFVFNNYCNEINPRFEIALNRRGSSLPIDLDVALRKLFTRQIEYGNIRSYVIRVRHSKSHRSELGRVWKEKEVK